MPNSPNDDQCDKVIQGLRRHASHLDSISHCATPEDVSYDMMSDAVVWSDETNESTPIQVVWALRTVRAYRTSLMLSRPRVELRNIWNAAADLFPGWIGFQPDRRRPSPRLLEIHRRGHVSIRKCLRDFERENPSVTDHR